MSYIVYKHTNKITNKCYIGMTGKTLEQRCGTNGMNYQKGKFFDSILQYGWMNYSHEVLESNLTFEEAKEKEKYYIKLYDSVENGYNTLDGCYSSEQKLIIKPITKDKFHTVYKNNLNFNVKLRTSLIRKIGEENYVDIYNSDYAIFDYIILKCMLNQKSNFIITTPRIMYKYFIDKEPNAKEIKNIKQGLDILLQNDIIYYNVEKRNYIIETDGLDFDSSCNKYFNIEPDYIKRVVNCHNGIKLLHYYITLCSTINVITNYGFRSQEDLSKLIKINVKTIRNYNTLLQNLNVICFSKHQNTVDKNGNFINLPKLYTFPEYADIIDTEQKDIINKAQTKANKKKRIISSTLKSRPIIVEEENENPFE